MCHTSDYSNCWGIPSGFLRSTPARKRSEFPGTELDRSAACWLQLPARASQSRTVLPMNPELIPSPRLCPRLGKRPLLRPMRTVEPALLAQAITLIA